MIEELKKFTPAEVLMLKDTDVKIDKLAQVTFFDLVLRGVLQTSHESKATQKKLKDPIVSVGANFSNFKPLKHEAIFLSIFQKDPTLKIKLANLLKASFQNIESSNHYKGSYVYSKDRMKKYFKASLIQRLLGTKEISKFGKKRQIQIKSALTRLNNKSKSNLSLENLLALRGNIVLIPKISESLFKALINETEINPNRAENSTEWDYGGLYLINNSQQKNSFAYLPELEFEQAIIDIDGFSDTAGDSGFGADGGDAGCGVGCGGGCGGCG